MLTSLYFLEEIREAFIAGLEYYSSEIIEEWSSAYIRKRSDRGEGERAVKEARTTRVATAASASDNAPKGCAVV